MKIGDRVRILADVSGSEIKKGDIGVIVEIDSDEQSILSDTHYRVETPNVKCCNWVPEYKLILHLENTKTYKIGKFYDVDGKETTNFNFSTTVDIDLHPKNMGVHYAVMSVVVKMENDEVILTFEELQDLVNKLNS